MNIYSHYTSKEFQELTNKQENIAVLATGSIEQHGNHLPMSVDFDIANEVVNTLCKKHEKLIYLPPIYYGARSLPQSGGVNDYDSSISVTGKVLIDTFECILKSLFKSGVRQMIVINAHYENELFLCEAAECIKRDIPEFKLVILSWWTLLNEQFIKENLGKKFAGWECEHAGYCETCMMLFLYPEKVRYINDKSYKKGFKGIYDNFTYLNKSLPNIGVLSSSKGATAEIGRLMFEEVLLKLENIITAMEA